MKTLSKMALPTYSLLLILAPTWAPLTPRVSAQAQANSRYFPPTGHSIRGRFLAYWDSHGGLAQQGYPLTEEISEISPVDGKTRTVQYFERAVFEYHPENKPPYDMLLSLLGATEYANRYGKAGAPGQESSADNPITFKETGKTLGGTFRRYWDAHGGLMQQGFPISNEFQERNALDGKTYTVQYFQRAVFELHPENAGTQYEVLLSLLGSFEYNYRHEANKQALVLPLPPPRPGFGQWSPHGSDSYLTWTEMSYPTPGEDHVMAMNLSSGQVITVTNKPGLQDGEDLSGSLVLWQDKGLCPPCSKSDIYVTDLDNGQLYDIAGPVGSEYNNEARISGHSVAWIAYANGDRSILLRDLDTGVTTTVARPEPFASGGMYFAHVAVSDEFVAWDGIVPQPGARARGDEPYQVQVYVRRTGEVRTVARGTVALYDDAPDLALSGDRLVWLDTRLNMADLSTGSVSILPMQNGDSPELRGDLLVWHWQYSIVAAHLDDSLATPVQLGDETVDYSAPTIAGDWVVWETGIGANAGHLGAKSLSEVFNPSGFVPTHLHMTTPLSEKVCK